MKSVVRKEWRLAHQRDSFELNACIVHRLLSQRLAQHDEYFPIQV
ncbi:MAG: hypothetical protein U5L74_05800 [Ideonella sp.]|nr:hypothetical protein [Ideonella sp.]